MSVAVTVSHKLLFSTQREDTERSRFSWIINITTTPKKERRHCTPVGSNNAFLFLLLETNFFSHPSRRTYNLVHFKRKRALFFFLLLFPHQKKKKNQRDKEFSLTRILIVLHRFCSTFSSLFCSAEEEYEALEVSSFFFSTWLRGPFPYQVTGAPRLF